ncbi:MAG: triose-phosphate isomerase [Chloroflexi bacterium]|nr:triose-phosphate isomerase [Chloroflexota bacterium]
MRTPLIAANWKMNGTLDETGQLIRAMRPGLDAISGVEVLICPPSLAITVARVAVKGSAIKLGVQNMFYEDKGAYTGELSPLMLKGVCDYVIVGHSERRQYFHEDDAIVNRKLQAARRHGLRPVLCVGEALEQREKGQTDEFIVGQLRQDLAGVEAAPGLVIAYEPVWAIGTGRPATGAAADEVCGLIRRTVADTWGAAAAEGLRVLYGGSVTGANAGEFLAQPEIDGALVGGASLKPAEFVAIVQAAARARPA